MSMSQTDEQANRETFLFQVTGRGGNYHLVVEVGVRVKVWHINGIYITVWDGVGGKGETHFSQEK